MDQHPLKTFRDCHEPPLTRSDLAKLLGVSVATVSRWEANERKVDERLLPKVSQRTGIPRWKLRPDLAALIQQPESVE